MKLILIADDDPSIRSLLRHVLTGEGYSVAEAKDGEQATALLRETQADLAVVDVMMPRLDGLALCQHIRDAYDIPIILLTAREGLSDKERGYLSGTDDYMTKPFEPRELIFRIKALFRRYSRAASDRLTLNRVVVDRQTYEVTADGATMLLPLKEFELLAQLAQYPGRVFTRDDLIALVWGADYDGDSRTVDVHIKRLRERFRSREDDFVITTVRGIGYKLEVASP